MFSREFEESMPGFQLIKEIWILFSFKVERWQHQQNSGSLKISRPEQNNIVNTNFQADLETVKK